LKNGTTYNKQVLSLPILMPKKGKTSGKAEVEKKEETKKEPEVAADKKGNGKNKGGKGKKK